MENLKIRNLRNKTEIDGLTYCMGENEAFTGIFVEKAENNSERHEIKETYDKGIIVKREEFKRFYTEEKVYKMFLVKSMIYENGKLSQEKIFEYNKYGELKKEIIPNEKVLYYNNQNKVGETDFETYKKNRTIKKIVITVAMIGCLVFCAKIENDSGSNSKNYNTKDDTYYMKELEREVNRQLNDPETRRQLEEEAKKEIEKAKREMGI
ncbi:MULTISPECIES: hypothetical protein [Fusobacterium]|jgi:hypothetical protein|uniref:hypothetical protein n=1 Tax=Fusobacterium TaxID=848 RepID=UPI0030CDBA73